jgi:hypothetical protein
MKRLDGNKALNSPEKISTATILMIIKTYLALLIAINAASSKTSNFFSFHFSSS